MGQATSVTGREFTVDVGDTASMAFKPMDDSGFVEIEVGDRAKVGGESDTSLFDEREVGPDWIIELGKKGGSQRNPSRKGTPSTATFSHRRRPGRP